MAGFLVGIGKAGEVAERSPAVISANLKEEMLLQKKRIVLDRSARNLVHQIKVDQKVVYKNFQSRLIRSKLAFARLMGQKDIEKELRAKNLGGLNTDIVGSADEEYSFLDKLEHRPCTATSISPRVAMPKKSKARKENGLRNSLVKNHSVTGQTVSTVLNERPVSATATVETNVKVKPSVSQREMDIRPATTTGLRVDNDFIRHQEHLLKDNKDKREINQEDNDLHFEDKENSVESSDNDTKKQVQIPDKDTNKEHTGGNRPSTIDGDDSELSNNDVRGITHDGDLTATDVEETEEVANGTKPSVAFLENLELDLEKLRRPQTTALTRQASGMSESPPISPKLLSGRASSRASDFFQEEKKIDVIQLRLNAARAVDFTEQVKTFCESLERTQDTRNKPTSDYYTIRLAASMKERMTSEIAIVPGTPDDENLRAVGNIHIRSLTVPDIDWNFE